jgi:predicted AAA+ superfamily ATPase
MEKLFQFSLRLLNHVETTFVRQTHKSINWQNRLIGLIGPRGVGKTTMVLQHIKTNLDPKTSLYVTAEDFYFSKHQIIELAAEFVREGGKHLFIDEIHKYPDWSREIKLIYDYHPDLQVVFTGSSILDIKEGSADLSRRAVVYNMPGLSFREYLELFHRLKLPTYSLEEIVNHKINSSIIKHPLPLFKSYLKRGYYPFSSEEDFEIKLKQVVNHTLEIDIPTYSNMNVSTGRKLKQLLGIISQSVPFKPNRSKIAEMLNISRNNVSDYLFYMEEAGMINQLRNHTRGIRALGKVNKIYLDNTNLLYCLGDGSENMGNIRETFFLNQLKVNHEIFTSEYGDFKVGDFDFEIGGKSKGAQQVKTAPNGIIVRDDIEDGYLNIIPLWHFGLLY